MDTQIISNAPRVGKFSTQLAIGSFAFGTLLFLLHLGLPNEDGIFILGFFYVLFAALINGIVFVNLLFHFTINPQKREIIVIKMMILLSNIPIALMYFYLIIKK